MTRIVLNRGFYTMQALENVYAYRPWIRVMHSFNRFDLLASSGDVKVERDLRSGVVVHSGYLRATFRARYVDPLEWRPMILTLSWYGIDLRLKLDSDGGGERMDFWDSGPFRGSEYIGHVIFSLHNWLDSADLELV